jgi:tRNA pseudouridine38-40 synthase
MNNYYKCIVAYDGTAYAGWQAQPDQPSIEKTLHSTFTKTFKHPITIHGASRTDAGVHALGQVMLCITPLTISPYKLRYAWNNVLPSAIVIRLIEVSTSSFHPRQSVKQKIYNYYIFTRAPLPFAYSYGWFYRYPFNNTTLEKALQLFVGTHNFRSFCTGDSYTQGTIRTIDTITVTKIAHTNTLEITVKGQRFMRYMIRRLVGAAITIATKSNYSLNTLAEIFDAKNPAHSLPTAPAHGLFLSKIIYH